MIALFSGSPGTIGVTPDFLGLGASSRMSSRRLAMRELLSGPWHRKQVSDMIGRMSRLNRTSGSAAAAAKQARTKPVIALARMFSLSYRLAAQAGQGENLANAFSLLTASSVTSSRALP